jgi:hypothetical protein
MRPRKAAGIAGGDYIDNLPGIFNPNKHRPTSVIGKSAKGSMTSLPKETLNSRFSNTSRVLSRSDVKYFLCPS